MADHDTDDPCSGTPGTLHKQFLHLQPVLHSLRDTLANLDVAYEQERENLDTVLSDEDLKRIMQEKLQERHRRQREPYLQQLTILQRRNRGSVLLNGPVGMGASSPSEARRTLAEPTRPLPKPNLTQPATKRPNSMTDEEIEYVAEARARVGGTTWYPGHEQGSLLRIVSDRYRYRA